MKTRQGFVSNSSSSSFICNLDKDSTQFTLEEVESKLSRMIEFYNEMFPNDKKSMDRLRVLKVSGKHYKEMHKWYVEDMKRVILDNKDYIIIEDGEDNYYPYSLYEITERIFHATRIHLG